MGNAQQLRRSSTRFTTDDALRVRLLVERLGSLRAVREALGMGEIAFDALRSQGRTETRTRDRVLEAIAKADAAPVSRVDTKGGA